MIFQKPKKPYASKLKRQVTIRMDEDTVKYFKQIAQNIGIPYQKLINLYLRDCAASHKNYLYIGSPCNDYGNMPPSLNPSHQGREKFLSPGGRG